MKVYREEDSFAPEYTEPVFEGTLHAPRGELT